MRKSLVGLVAVTSLMFTGLSASAPLPGVSFSVLPPGWHVVDASNGASALSWHYRENPYGWASSMPKNSIVVSVFFPRKVPQYPPLKLVLPKRPAATLEGAPDTPEYRIHGRVRGRNVAIWIDIRRPNPTKAQLRAAQRVVSGIRFTDPL